MASFPIIRGASLSVMLPADNADKTVPTAETIQYGVERERV
jgi:hypothetical protein